MSKHDADLSPQDSTLLSDVVEVGALPCLTREDGETRYCFYISTRHGLRYECSSVSKIQVMVVSGSFTVSTQSLFVLLSVDYGPCVYMQIHMRLSAYIDLFHYFYA